MRLEAPRCFTISCMVVKELAIFVHLLTPQVLVRSSAIGYFLFLKHWTVFGSSRISINFLDPERRLSGRWSEDHTCYVTQSTKQDTIKFGEERVSILESHWDKLPHWTQPLYCTGENQSYGIYTAAILKFNSDRGRNSRKETMTPER